MSDGLAVGERVRFSMGPHDAGVDVVVVEVRLATANTNEEDRVLVKLDTGATLGVPAKMLGSVPAVPAGFIPGFGL